MAETIKEFLVALGFQVDENAFNKFDTRLARATSGALTLGTQVTATALAIQSAVAKMATAFEEMFYISQRTNSSVASLTSFGNAARTIGVTSDAARGAVEGLSRAMRSNPGVGALINNLGIGTKGRQDVDVLMDLVGKLRQMPFYVAQQIAGLAGIDSDTLLMLQQRYDELRVADEKYKKQLKESGVDSEDLARKSRTFNNSLRDLEVTLGILGNRIHQNFIEPATQMINVANDLAKKFIEMDKATNGWATTIGTIATSALGAWIAKMLLARLLFGSAAGGAAAVAGGTAAAAGGAAAGASLLTRAKRGVLGLGIAGLGIAKADAESGNGLRSWLRSQLGLEDPNEPAPWQKGGSWQYTSNAEQKRRRGIAERFFQSMGWNRAQATGITSNLARESNFNEKAIGDGGKAVGLAQWHPDRQANFRRVFGKDLRDATFEEQLQFIHYELTQGAEQAAGNILRKTNTPEEAAAAVSKFYERPRDAQGEAGARARVARKFYDEAPITGNGGGSNVQVTNNNEFNVNTSDPQKAAKEVLTAQRDVNARTVREMKSTVQ